MSIARPTSQLFGKPMTPTNNDIEAAIQMATANLHLRHLDVVRLPHNTRTPLFVGNLPYRVRSPLAGLEESLPQGRLCPSCGCIAWS
ncbi:hypothetical protein FISHEDRAFT_74305 [Fistulina hepatica ATCC 64428]|uniref:Uncharacterized protein n=1 Tax=Fistulina hepatica ATCC 64428 TaxID=1128425 RepID=A0A0D7ACV5_9AGAR|nr:hypothetical protein FISHEDRAFT_74305 [Fistulina hepatica ATCC 64428]